MPGRKRGLLAVQTDESVYMINPLSRPTNKFVGYRSVRRNRSQGLGMDDDPTIIPEWNPYVKIVDLDPTRI